MKRLTEESVRQAMGRVIAQIRESRGMRQAELGEQSTIAKAESGSNFPRLGTWLEIARVLRVPIDEMLRLALEGLDGKPGRTVAALDPEQAELQALYQRCNAEGRRVLLERARACAKLFPK